MAEKQRNPEYRDSSYEFFILAISLVAITNLIIIWVTPSVERDDVLRIMNFLLSILLLADFFFRLFTTPSKRDYLIGGYGWLDFLGSLPFLGIQLLRISRVIRIIRLMREYGTEAISTDLKRNRAGSALALASLLVILVLQFGSYFIIGIEASSPQANIVNPFDALWWSLVTIATVGYGDKYPVTINGRLIGALVIVSGVGLFSVFTGFLARKFFSHEDENRVPTEIMHSLTEIQSLLESQSASIAELEEKVSSLEKKQ